MSNVIVHRRALRYLQRLPRPQQKRVQEALRRLEEDAVSYPGVIHMVGEWAGYHRIRVGDLRVIFLVR